MEKDWMKPPLPPLSESIIGSGLVTGDYTIVSQQPQPEKPTQRPRATSVTSSHKVSPILASQRRQSNQDLSCGTAIIDPAKAAKTSRTLETSHLNRSIPKPKQNKPPPIEQFHIYTKDERNQIIQEKKGILPDDNNRSISPVSFSTPKRMTGYVSQRPSVVQNSAKKSLRSETYSIIQELEENYSNILPHDVDITTLPVAKQAEIRAKLLNLHNFSFNNIILEERKTCEERALLLRRFHKFYNQQLAEIPALDQKINNYITEYNIKYDSLVEHAKQLESLNLTNSNTTQELESELEKLKSELKKVTEESNQKDIQLSSNTFDLDFSKGQVAQLQFKLQEKNDEVQALTKTVNDLDEQNKNQFLQIDSLSKSLNQLQQADSGYIAMYNKEHENNEILTKQNQELTEIIYQLTHIEKVDIEIQIDQDDEFFRCKPFKKKKSNTVQKDPKQKLSSTLSPNQIQLKDDDTNYLTSSTIMNTKQLVRTNPDYTKTLQQIITSSQMSLMQKAETVDIEVQTDPVQIITTTNEPKETKVIPQVSTEKIYSLPPNYRIDHSKLDALPDLFEMIMPILSQPYTSSTETELKVLNLTTNSTVVSSERPVVWALQLIHNFLTDPILRSLSRIDKLPTEVIFVNWLNQQYRLQHLIAQVLSDFSNILINFRGYSSLLPFFTNILMGKYSYTQLSFLSTIYSISLEFTFPNLSNCLQSMDFEEDINIHLECIEKLVSKCFTDEISSKFVKDNFVLNHSENVNANGLVQFTLFLEKAMELFGQEHTFLYSQSKDLLYICGCYDCENISFDSFVKFFCMLGANQYQSHFQYKTEWKKAISREQGKENVVMHLSRILTVCAEKKKPLMELLELKSLKPSVARIKSLNSFVSDLFYNLLTRYSTSLPHVIEKLPREMVEQFKEPYEKIRIALLNAEIAKVIYLYRLVVMKIDLLVMEDKGFIPFNPNSNFDVLAKLTEYLDRSESVAFAMID